MSRQRYELVTAMLQNKMYDVITEYASIDHPEKGNLIVTEYCGKSVRAWKDDKGNTRVMCPKNMDTIQEGHVANAIANGTIFDDADEVSRNAEMVEKMTLPMNGIVNRGMDTPKHVRPMIAIVIGRMGEDGTFDTDAGRVNAVNFVKDLCCKDKDVDDVCDNYLEKDPDSYYGKELGHEIYEMKPEIEEIRDVDYEDTISDDDVVDSYDGYDMDEVEGKEAPAEVDPETEETDEPEETEDKLVDDTEVEVKDDEVEGEEEVEECGDMDSTCAKETAIREESFIDKTDDEYFEEGFLSKKPKKLKPIGRDVVAYITVEMNAIHSSNDQAMLAGYTCSKIELVDFYLNCLDTNDARYIVPHNKQYLTQMKTDLENLLAQILRIRPINRTEQIWRVNYPTT